MGTRSRVSYVVELLLWIAALMMCVALLADVARTGSLMSLGSFIVIAGLVWWPMIRTRIKFGYWMRDWDDHPARHFSETPISDRP